MLAMHVGEVFCVGICINLRAQTCHMLQKTNLFLKLRLEKWVKNLQEM